jgi:hypothetical protein
MYIYSHFIFCPELFWYLNSILWFSEEEARHKIYSVSTWHYFAFGALVSEELSYKIKGITVTVFEGFFSETAY